MSVRVLDQNNLLASISSTKFPYLSRALRILRSTREHKHLAGYDPLLHIRLDAKQQAKELNSNRSWTTNSEPRLGNHGVDCFGGPGHLSV